MSGEVPAVKSHPETLMLFDRQDDTQIANRLRGIVLKEFVYGFKQGGQMIYGLGVDGAEACKRELAKVGEVIREDEITIMYQDAERVYFQARASRWAVNGKSETKLDTTVELKNQMKYITRRDGSTEADPFWLEKGGSKAMRNAILNLIPEEIKQRVIAMYKESAKVVEMAPEVADAMTHEAAKSMQEADERKTLVYQLQERWRDLGLMQSAVKMILEKKGLPAVLATRNADWSSVDLAVIKDLLEDSK